MIQTAGRYFFGVMAFAAAGLIHGSAMAATTIPSVNFYGYFGNSQGEPKIQLVKNGEALYYAPANEDILASNPPPLKNLDGRSFEVLTNGLYQIEYAINNYRFEGTTPSDVPTPKSEFLAINLTINGKVDVGGKNDCSTNALIPALPSAEATQTLSGSVSHSCLLRLRTGNKIRLVPKWTVPSGSSTSKSTFQMFFPASEASNNANVFRIMLVKISD